MYFLKLDENFKPDLPTLLTNLPSILTKTLKMKMIIPLEEFERMPISRVGN